MAMNFPVVHPWVLAHEGGYVNHPRDPGGATMEGITQRTYDGWRRRRGMATRDVKHITAAERDAIYREGYWNTVAGDELPAGLDYAMYDYAVNSGPARANKELQRLLGVDADGIMGSITLGAVKEYSDVEDLIIKLCVRRMNFLRGLKHWNTFKKGWTRRVMGDQEGFQPDDDDGVIDRAVALYRKKPTKAPHVRHDNSGAKAPESELPGRCIAFLKRIWESLRNEG